MATASPSNRLGSRCSRRTIEPCEPPARSITRIATGSGASPRRSTPAIASRSPAADHTPLAPATSKSGVLSINARVVPVATSTSITDARSAAHPPSGRSCITNSVKRSLPGTAAGLAYVQPGSSVTRRGGPPTSDHAVTTIVLLVVEYPIRPSPSHAAPAMSFDPAIGRGVSIAIGVAGPGSGAGRGPRRTARPMWRSQRRTRRRAPSRPPRRWATISSSTSSYAAMPPRSRQRVRISDIPAVIPPSSSTYGSSSYWSSLPIGAFTLVPRPLFPRGGGLVERRPLYSRDAGASWPPPRTRWPVIRAALWSTAWKRAPSSRSAWPRSRWPPFSCREPPGCRWRWRSLSSAATRRSITPRSRRAARSTSSECSEPQRCGWRLAGASASPRCSMRSTSAGPSRSSACSWPPAACWHRGWARSSGCSPS